MGRMGNIYFVRTWNIHVYYYILLPIRNAIFKIFRIILSYCLYLHGITLIKINYSTRNINIWWDELSNIVTNGICSKSFKHIPNKNLTFPLQSLTRYTKLQLYSRAVLYLPAFIFGLRLVYIIIIPTMFFKIFLTILI